MSSFVLSILMRHVCEKTIDIIEYEPVFLVRVLSFSKKFHPHHTLTNPKDSYPRTCSNVHTLVLAIHSLSLFLSLSLSFSLRTLSDSFLYPDVLLASQHFFFFLRCYTGYTGFYNLIVQLFNNETCKINIYLILFISRV